MVQKDGRRGRMMMARRTSPRMPNRRRRDSESGPYGQPGGKTELSHIRPSDKSATGDSRFAQQHTFEISIHGVSLSMRRKTEFKYKLEGQDPGLGGSGDNDARHTIHICRGRIIR